LAEVGEAQKAAGHDSRRAAAPSCCGVGWPPPPPPPVAEALRSLWARRAACAAVRVGAENESGI